MSYKKWARNLFAKALVVKVQEKIKKHTSKIHLMILEDRIVPAVPFSPSFPHALSITTGGGPVSTTAQFTVTFNQPVIGVDATDFKLVSSGTVAGAAIASVSGSGASYTVNVTGITGNGTLGLNLVDLPSVTALPSFANQQTFETGAGPWDLKLGDVNGDGNLDIVTADRTNDNISVLLGNGNGTFQAKQTFATGDFPAALMLGDVNKDGKLDIVTSDFFSDTISVLLGNGNGTFQNQQTYAGSGDTYSAILGDVNGDGRLDIVTANSLDDNTSVLLGNGDGTFQAQQTFATGNNPYGITLGDVNGDGRLDIVTANNLDDNTSVLLGNGDGTFQAQQTFATGNRGFSVALGDLNGDGRLDIVMGGVHPDTAIGVLLGNGDGSFQPFKTFAAGKGLHFLALGDVNGDGKLDIVVGNYQSKDTSVLLGNGDGTFQPQQTFSNDNRYPNSIELGDVDGDGRLDIVALLQGFKVGVLLGTGGSAITATFSPQQTFATGDRPYGVALGDVNGDGRLDMVVANSLDHNTSVLLGNGDGTFQTQQTFATGGSPRGVTLGDVNGDGRLDLVTANNFPNNISVLLGNGNGTFQAQQTLSTGFFPNDATLGDVNGDGRLDIVTANTLDDNTSVLLGNGDGTFQAQQTFATGDAPISVTLGDVNGDGRLDIVTANHLSDNTSVLLGNGDGTLQAQQSYATGDNSFSVTLSDVNGDGRLDMVVANFNSDNASVLLGNGNGTFQVQQTFATGDSPVSVILGDVNGDGRLDMVVANFNSDNSSVLLNSLAFVGQSSMVQNPTPTTTTLTATPNPSVFGQSVTFNATVTGSSGIPTGTVTFKNGPTIMGTATLDGSGIASLVTNTLLVGGPYTITAEYSGDSINQISTSPAVSQTVNQASTITSLIASPNPSVLGQSVTFTATIGAVAPGAGIPTGSVAFFEGATLLGTGTITSGVATLSISNLSVASHGITAVYGGDSSFTGSTSSLVTQTVNQAPVVTSSNSTTFIQGLATNSFQVAANGFPASFNYSITTGNLPGGVVLNPNTGVLSGAPVGGTVGTHTVSISVNNGINPVATQVFTLTVNPVPVPLLTSSITQDPNNPNLFVSTVNRYLPQTNQTQMVAVPFPGFNGEVRVSGGDFDLDGTYEIVAGAGPGGGPVVTILDSQTGLPRASFFAYAPSFTGGIFVAVKDINNDGIADIITGAGVGGGPHVKVFNGLNLQEMRSFFAYDSAFKGGVSVSAADINGDNILDIVTGAGVGGGPHVKVFDGATDSIIAQWFAYPVFFTGGVFVAVGDIGNDGSFEVVTGAGHGGGPVVAVWNPFTGQLLSQFLSQFLAYEQNFTGGVRVGVSDATGDGVFDLVTGAGVGGGPHVKAFDLPNLNLLFQFYSDPESNQQGVFVS